MGRKAQGVYCDTKICSRTPSPPLFQAQPLIASVAAATANTSTSTLDWGYYPRVYRSLQSRELRGLKVPREVPRPEMGGRDAAPESSTAWHSSTPSSVTTFNKSQGFFNIKNVHNYSSRYTLFTHRYVFQSVEAGLKSPARNLQRVQNVIKKYPSVTLQ